MFELDREKIIQSRLQKQCFEAICSKNYGGWRGF